MDDARNTLAVLDIDEFGLIEPVDPVEANEMGIRKTDVL